MQFLFLFTEWVELFKPITDFQKILKVFCISTSTKVNMLFTGLMFHSCDHCHLVIKICTLVHPIYPCQRNFCQSMPSCWPPLFLMDLIQICSIVKCVHKPAKTWSRLWTENSLFTENCSYNYGSKIGRLCMIWKYRRPGYSRHNG